MTRLKFIILTIPLILANQRFSSEIIVDRYADSEFQPEVNILNERQRSYYSNDNITLQAEITVADPNHAGVSLNKFEEFGFGISSYSGGYINVEPKDAKLVIFDVTGYKASWMFGKIDANRKIDLVITNPNGMGFNLRNSEINSIKLIRDNAKLDDNGSFELNEHDNINSGIYSFSSVIYNNRIMGLNLRGLNEDFYVKGYNNFYLNKYGEIEY